MGISKYQNVPSLKYADRDAMSFYNFLLSSAGGAADTNNIRLLLNEKATSYNFFEAMDNLLDMAKEGDQVYIYFAGHGDIEKKTDRQNGFLIGSNAPANCYAAGGCIGVRYLQDYVETLVSTKKSKVTMIIDACRSGKLAGGSQGAEITALALQSEWKGVTKILSCQPGETSLEGEQWGGGAGVFTYFMLKGMLGQADENGDGKVSAMELGSYLDKIVMKETHEKQLPEIVGDRRQDIAKVDKNHALALLNQMERPILLPPEKQFAGFDADISSINDIEVLKEYEKFKYYINNNYLIAYDDADTTKETALSIYRSLESRRSAQPIISKMKGELLAALQNKAQISMNNWLNSINVDSLTNDSTYRELKIAFNISDTTYFQYNQLKVRYLLWSSFKEKDEKNNINILEECLKINPNDPLVNFHIGYLYGNMKNYNEEYEYSDKAVKFAKNWAWAWNNKGKALTNLGKYTEAINCYDKAIELKPDHIEAWCNKGNAFNSLGKSSEAIDCYDKAIKIQPNYYRAWNNKGNTLTDLLNYDEAIKCYDKVLDFMPNDFMAWYNKGKVNEQLGKYEEAIILYNKSIEIKPDYFEAWDNKGVMLINVLKFQDAIICFDKVLEIKPDNSISWNNKGIAFENLGKFKEAINCFDKALEIKSDYFEALYNKGHTLSAFSKYEDAVNTFDIALKIQPDNFAVWYMKGNAFLALQKIEEAINCYNKSLEINPHYFMASYNMGWVLVNQGKYEEALKFFDKVIEIKPDYYDAWLIKGAALYNLGKYEEAIISYEKTLELKPDYHPAWYNKACSNSLMKNKAEMLKSLKKAIELNKKYKVDAPKDKDFKEYWNDPEFIELVK